jgi:hypothetical protein
MGMTALGPTIPPSLQRADQVVYGHLDGPADLVSDGCVLGTSHAAGQSWPGFDANAAEVVRGWASLSRPH